MLISALLLVQQPSSGTGPQKDFGTVKGIVYDAGFGLPLGQAIITVTANDGSSRQTNSDSDGAYEFAALVPGRYRISVALRGFIVYVATLEVASGEEKILDVPLVIGHYTDVRGIEVTGVVSQADSSRPGGVTLSVIRAIDGARVLESRTNDTGNYKILLKDPGQYLFLAFKPGYRIAVVALVIQPSEIYKKHQHDFVLSPFTLK